MDLPRSSGQSGSGVTKFTAALCQAAMQSGPVILSLAPLAQQRNFPIRPTVCCGQDNACRPRDPVIGENRPVCVVATVGEHSLCLRRAVQQRCGTGITQALPAVMEMQSRRPSASMMTWSLVFLPPLVQPISRPRPVFTPRLDDVRCAFRYDASIMIVFGVALAAPSFHHAEDNIPFAPPLQSVVETPWRTIFPQCIALAQSFTVHENDGAPDLPIINP